MTQDIGATSPIYRLEQKTGRTWPHIAAARRQADLKRNQLRDLFVKGSIKYSPGDASIVVFGSLARGEVTLKSDLDWTLLIDGQANSDHQRTVQAITRLLKQHEADIGLRQPGPTGLFGSMTFSHDLIHHVGGDHDTNKNTTQRILLLLESTAIGGSDADAHSRVLTGILNRYLEEQDPFFLTYDSQRYRVPRFLLNDIVRFWRTMAVDFASKQRDRDGGGFGLRNAKLRMSRKLIFASGLLMCFNSHLDTAVDASLRDPAKQAEPILNYLKELARLTPLEVLASTLLTHDSDVKIAVQLFDSYDQFLGMLNDNDIRSELEGLRVEESRQNGTFSRIREIGNSFQHALDKLLFERKPFRDLTVKYGIF
jgi:predicted nucleotidyltransferase